MSASGRVARLVPAWLRRPVVGWRARRGRGVVRERLIVGRSLRVEGANHGEADYDDAWLVGLIPQGASIETALSRL